MNRVIRLALGAGIAAAALAPAAPAHAWACLDDVTRVVCTVYATGCSVVPDTSKYSPHDILCTFG